MKAGLVCGKDYHLKGRIWRGRADASCTVCGGKTILNLQSNGGAAFRLCKMCVIRAAKNAGLDSRHLKVVTPDDEEWEDAD